ncbi:MAG: hypothetical protein L0H83_12485 [Salinisphaera sp.]|nr:hypothetical protein [Salinisphaera sp.]
MQPLIVAEQARKGVADYLATTFSRRPRPASRVATLCEPWQTEMIDKLGTPRARWDTQKKVWLDHDERAISALGRDEIAKCPLRLGIVSTGLMLRESLEKQYLLGLRYGLVILDEAHKARSRQGLVSNASEPNNLLAFTREVAARADHGLLGTATPIQTKPEDLWRLMGILHQGEGRFVLGNDYAKWHRPRECCPFWPASRKWANPHSPGRRSGFDAGIQGAPVIQRHPSEYRKNNRPFPSSRS